MKQNREKLDKILLTIVEAVQPLKVILFGSAIRGEQSSESDYDILVVMPEGTHRRETSKLLYKKLAGMGCRLT